MYVHVQNLFGESLGLYTKLPITEVFNEMTKFRSQYFGKCDRTFMLSNFVNFES